MLVSVRLKASDFATGGRNHSRVRTRMNPGMTKITAISNASTVDGMAATARQAISWAAEAAAGSGFEAVLAGGSSAP
jgi:hypothetical protein